MRSARIFWYLRYIAAISVIFMIFNHGYFIDRYAEQNDCQFGDITNESYRELLKRASHLSFTKWPRLSGDEKKISEELKRRIDEIAGEDPTFYRQTAAIHAVMRQLNAYLVGDEIRGYKPWQSHNPPELPSLIGFVYSVPSLSFTKFGIIRVNEWAFPSILINIPPSSLPDYRVERDGDLSMGVRLTDWVSDFLKGEPLSDSPIMCPAMPPAKWAARFDDGRSKRAKRSH